MGLKRRYTIKKQQRFKRRKERQKLAKQSEKTETADGSNPSGQTK